MNIKLIHRTNDAEKLVGYMARVSSPNQDNPDVDKLLEYLIRNNHWSPLDMCDMCVEINTTRAIGRQILRHKSFFFQEFSQRYSKANEVEYVEARRQDLKNRQNSISDLSEENQSWFLDAQTQVTTLSLKLYKDSLNRGIAKESARFLLTENVVSKLYMKGTLRSWIHYCVVRCEKSTQKEHRDVAEKCWQLFRQEFPVIAKSAEEAYKVLDNCPRI